MKMTFNRFNEKDVFSWANCAEAPIGTKGFAANSLSALDEQIEVAPLTKCELKAIDPDCASCFTVHDEIIGDTHACFFLPAFRVKKAEKWRAYKNFDDFDYAVGDIIRFRPKHKRDNEYLCLITGFIYSENILCLNGEKYTFKMLFDEYELFNGTTWQDFGVLKE